MSGRILIAEDEFIVAVDLKTKLRRLGYEVVGVVASGEEAISLAEQERPDVVLMDIKLQGAINGLKAGELIQQRTGSAIIFVTAYAAMFLRNPEQMQSPGLCLSKPFSMVQLKAALQTVLKSWPLQ